MLKIALAAVAITLLVVVSTSSAATTWPVTKTADTSDGTCNSDCSLREAVTAASCGSTFGGGVFNSSGMLTVVDSTVANNSNINDGTLRARGGGVQQASTGLAPATTLDSSTIAGNSTGGTGLGFGGNLQAEAGAMTL